MKTKDIIWDIQTRIYHWLIAVPVFINFFVEGGVKWHRWLGYLALAGLMLRMIWGLRSSGHANLRALPLQWTQVRSYFLSLNKSDTKPYPGHNPIASWVYIAIWSNVVFLGLTGFMMGTDQFWGEEWLEEIHELLAVMMKTFVVLHLIGIIFDSMKFKRKTWLAMITGEKK